MINKSLASVTSLAALFMVAGSALAQTTGAMPADVNAANLAWGRARKGVALEMIRRLDVTSFPNSIGPRRAPGKRTLADYGFAKVEGFDDGWATATDPTDPWQISVFVLDDHPNRKRLCITDIAMNGGTYHTAAAIDVAPRPGGLWQATKFVRAVAGCGYRFRRHRSRPID